MKILLFGKDGQLGFELQRSLGVLGEVLAPARAQCDLAEDAAVRALVRQVCPDVIVNAAAYTAVDRAESDRAAAFAVNADGPRILGEEAARCGALVLHFSTDYVFSGDKNRPYTEQDQPGPLNVYGLSKLEGERALAQVCPRHLILRTSWVLGVHGHNFARTVLRLASERESFGVVADQVGAPTSAALLADLSAHLLRRHAGEGAGFPFGLFHATAGGETSWCDYARFVIDQAAAAGLALKAGAASVRALDTAGYPTAAQRPHNSRLDTARFRETFGLRLPPWEEGVKHVLRQLFAARPAQR